MNTEQKNKWEKIRQKGQFHFILGGILFWGLGIAFVSTLINYFFEFFFNNTPNYLHESDRSFTKILGRVVIFSFVGFYINYSSWNENEDEFFQNTEEK